MNILASLLPLGIGTLPINALLEEEIVVLTAADLDRKRSPVFFAVHRVGHTGFSVDFGLTASSGMAPDIGPFQLMVLSQPVAPADLPGQLSRADLIVRTEVVRAERATFEFRKEEIPNSALMIYLVTPSRVHAPTVRGFCLPLAELMKTARLANRRPLTGTDHPSAA